MTKKKPAPAPDLKQGLELIEQLTTALLKAQEHLDYCNYGDPWEHEAAEAQGLPQLIADAVEAGRVCLSNQGVRV